MSTYEKIITTSENKFVEINSRPHKVIIGMNNSRIKLSDAQFQAYKQVIKTAAEKAWPGIEPKVADSMSSDYDEMYDNKRDENFYLSTNNQMIKIDGYRDGNQMKYSFNKRRMQSYLADLFDVKEE